VQNGDAGPAQDKKSHAGEACIGRNREPCSVIKDLPLLAMREVLPRHPDLEPRTHVAFSRQTRTSIVSTPSRWRVPGVKEVSRNHNRGGGYGSAGTATESSLFANRARKSNHGPSHIDDWMYAKLAWLRSNVNENCVWNAHSGGILCAVPVSRAGECRAESQDRAAPQNSCGLPFSAQRAAGEPAT
jgi:hypothetical protein